MIYGQHIRAARAILKMSQLELAELAGLSFVTIKKIEEVDTPVSTRTQNLYKLIEIFKERGVLFETKESELTIKFQLQKAPA
jgi:transcriptional regulator with XRE-family HTH domain